MSGRVAGPATFPTTLGTAGQMSDRPARRQDPDPSLVPRSVADRVLRRAVELQDRHGEMVPEETIYEIAAEMDVHPEYVRLAMEQVRSDASRHPGRVGTAQEAQPARPAPPPAHRRDRAEAGSDELYLGTMLCYILGFFSAVAFLVGFVLTVALTILLPVRSQTWIDWFWPVVPQCLAVALLLGVAGTVYEGVRRLFAWLGSGRGPGTPR